MRVRSLGSSAPRPTVVALALIAVAAGCGPETPEQELDFRATVSVDSVRTGRVERLLVTTGTVRASDVATVVVETAGNVDVLRNPATGLRFAIGDEVRRGQVLALVDPQEVATSARLDQRRQALESVRAEHERNVRLHEEGLISEQALDEVAVRLSSAEADYQNARVQAAKSSLASPLTGVLTVVITAADGTFAGAGTQVAEVMSFDEVIVDLDLGTGEVMEVAGGLPVRVRSYSSERVFEGHVMRIAPAIDPESRTFRVEVRVPNEDHRLRPGMFVRADVVLEARDEVVKIPTDAILERGGRLLVFVVEAQRAQLREVVIGLVSEDGVEITDGLAVGERVVVSGQETLQDGTRVIVRG